MRKAISGVLVIAMMMSTFGASNVQAASINSGSNYVEENGVIVEASVTDAEDIEDNGYDNQEETSEEVVRTKGNLDSVEVVNVVPADYVHLEDYDETIKEETSVKTVTIEASDDRKNADRIHYINLNDGNPSHTSDAIVIESNGHYGLIDASNRDAYQDGAITKYDPNNANGSATGRAVLNYLAALGVDHLDFVLVTHSHSDHLGGVPDIVKDVVTMDITNESESVYDVEEKYYDPNDGYKPITNEDIINVIKEDPEDTKTSETTYGHLVDKDTTYIYKSYTNNPTEDGWGWNNGEYFSKAWDAMKDTAKLAVNNHSGMDKLGATFSANGPSNIDDTISFKMGDYNISLYNLYAQSNSDENANSIITYIEKAGTKTVLLADLDLYNNLENQIGSAIVNQHGKVNVMKVAHHGNTKTDTPASTSKQLIDTLGASYGVVCTSNVAIPGYTPFYGYMKTKGMGVYRTMDVNGNAIVQDMTGSLSFKTSSVENVNPGDKLVCKITTTYSVTTQMYKYYGIAPTTEGEEPVINAKKEYNETKNVTEIKTVTQDTTLSLGGAPSDWKVSGAGTNDWQKWYKSSSDYDWVHLNSDGTHKKGWQVIYSSPRGKNYTYYFGNDGIMQMGWTTIGGKRAYLRTADNSNGPQGSLATGWEQISGAWYYFDADGKGHEGWMQNNADWYYIDNGLMYTGGLRSISGTNYFFGSDGKMKSGWQKSGGESYYFDSNGKAHSGWVQSGGKWYYTESSGKMVTSQWVDNYWIGSNGVWSYQYKGSWKSNSKGWWYEDASGWYPKSCWQKINGELYYFGSDGYMAANEWIDGKWINGSGYSGRYKYTGSWKSNSKGWWFTDTSGWYPVNKWQKINGKWYYFEGDGYMASNKYIDGYWVNSSGACE